MTHLVEVLAVTTSEIALMQSITVGQRILPMDGCLTMEQEAILGGCAVNKEILATPHMLY